MMNTAIYIRVSTQRQAQAQTIEQQLEQLQSYANRQGWQIAQEHILRDEGYSGAHLNRPGLDRLRDQVAMAQINRLLVLAPDRLARNFVHQTLLVDGSKNIKYGIDSIFSFRHYVHMEWNVQYHIDYLT